MSNQIKPFADYEPILFDMEVDESSQVAGDHRANEGRSFAGRAFSTIGQRIKQVPDAVQAVVGDLNDNSVQARSGVLGVNEHSRNMASLGEGVGQFIDVLAGDEPLVDWTTYTGLDAIGQLGISLLAGRWINLFRKFKNRMVFLEGKEERGKRCPPYS